MKLKEDLNKVYQEWQEKIDRRNVNSRDFRSADTKRNHFTCRFEALQNILEYGILNSSDAQVKEELKLLSLEVERFQEQLNEKYVNFCVFVNNIVNEQKRLGSRRIQQFEDSQLMSHLLVIIV